MMRLFGILLLGLLVTTSWAMAESARPSMEEALEQIKVPPDWFQTVEIHYDTNHLWEDARLEIRRLLSLGSEEVREAIKLTYLYREKKDIGNGHEYPMYLFLGGEYAWALQAYQEYLKPKPKGYTHEYRAFASCYAHFGEYERTLEILDIAMQRLPDPPWQIANRADLHDGFGDIYADMGDLEQAKQHYQKAIELYPTSDQPYGRHLLHRRAGKVQAKMDLLELQAIESGQLQDGTYTAQSLGFAEILTVKMTVKAGKIVDIQIEHEEKIDQNATTIIPQRIIAEQSLKVDGITGATVTYQAIEEGTFRALKKARLR
ncbi:FMN-binding protein [Candidatus Poribacteria bacterium]